MTATGSLKRELRRTFLAQRQALPRETWQQKNLTLCQQIQSVPIFQAATTILAYFSIRQEPDLSSLFGDGHQWGFPRCVGPDLSWHHWSPGSALPLQKGAYQIPEPHPDAPLITPDQIDLILLPAVACDRRGYRLGYGGGYYDRLLSRPPWRDKPTIAVIFDMARVDVLPTDAWDIPVSGSVTEAGFFATLPKQPV